MSSTTVLTVYIAVIMSGDVGKFMITYTTNYHAIMSQVGDEQVFPVGPTIAAHPKTFWV